MGGRLLPMALLCRGDVGFDGAAGPVVRSVLAAIGVHQDAELLYRRILREGGQAIAGHAASLHWPVNRARVALDTLTAAGLARADAHGQLHAENPRLSITRLLERENSKLDHRRRELNELRAAVSDFAAEHRAGQGGSIAATALEIIPPQAEVAMVEELLRTTTGVLRSVHLDVGAGPAIDPTVYRLAREQVAKGRELRSVYPAKVLDDPVLLQWVTDWAAVGEQQRVVEAVPHEFVVFGDEAVVAPPHWGSTDGGTVVIRLPLLVQAFTRLFEDAWTSGLPVPGPDDGQLIGTRLLTLLATGLKDEAIARYLGVGVRTVRRRVAELMADLGVHTRFQLGVAAERGALLGRPRRTGPPAVGRVVR